MDPPLTEKGEPYKPIKFQNIITERYLISKHINTSYEEVGKISPAERKQLLALIKKDLEKRANMIEEQKQKVQ